MKLIAIHGLESCSNHNAALALFEDGICTVCLPVERISRNKLAINEPVNWNIIQKVLNYKSLKKSDINYWVVPASFDYKKYELDNVVILGEENHHLAHIAGSFYSSNFDHACCVCSDGIGGNKESITLAYATREKGIEILKTFDFTTSLGIYYEAAANLVTGRSSEGKFMGLASWGNKKGLHPIKVDIENETIETQFNNKNCQTIEESRKLIEQYWMKNYLFENIIYGNSILKHADFAAQVQDDLNEVILGLAKIMKKRYPNEENLCVSGGTFLNCTSNGLLDGSGLFTNIHCTPQPHDEGQAIGKGLLYLEKELNIKTQCKNLDCYLSFDYTIEDLYEHINKDAIIVEPYNEEKIINTLNNDGIIAWYQGRSETGPRALCHRSLLASPKNRDMLKKLSVDVKGREFYRPLAPVCIDSLYNLLFDDPHPQNLTKYMLKTVIVKEEWRDQLPAITHIDNTARPQYLEKKDSPRLYHLMERLYEETNIPCLINTSLNAKGDPIIETPKDLLDFLRKNPLVNYCVFNGRYIVTIKDRECI